MWFMTMAETTLLFVLFSLRYPDSVTKVCSDVFALCYRLIEVNLPNSITEIGSAAFLGCQGLTNICIPDTKEKFSKLLPEHAHLLEEME